MTIQENSTCALNDELTLDQHRLVLETIARRCDALNRLLMEVQGTTDDFDLMSVVDTAQAMIEHIGAMADSACGRVVVGDANHWLHGQRFKDCRHLEGALPCDEP